MRGIVSRRLAAVTFLLALVASIAGAGEIISIMRNVNAVPEHQGFRINPAYDSAAPMGAGDLAPVQAFEILRPQDRPVTIGRLYTSCTCIRLEAPKRSFGPNERAILQLRNISPTPLNGQVYAIYVQIISPINTTLRFDTFVQSNSAIVTNSDRSTGTNAPAGTVEPPVVGSANPPAVPDIEIIVPKSGLETENAEAETAKDDASEATDTETAAADDKKDEAGTPPADPMDAYFADDAKGDKGDKDEEGGVAMPVLVPPSSPSTAENTGADLIPPAPAATETVPATPTLTLGGNDAPVRAEASAGAGRPTQAISLITIGVRDMGRSIAFYEALGWPRAARNKYDQTAFFQLNGQILALYPLKDLLGEQNMASAAPSPGGITLAIHVDSKEDVDKLYRAFADAGGKTLKAPTEMPSGAVTCYVADPDGTTWEISWVPQFRVDKDGGLWLP